MFDDLFGGMFDYSGDGHTVFSEEAVGFAIMEEMINDGDNSENFDNDSDDEW